MMEMHQPPRNSVTVLYKTEEESGLANIIESPQGNNLKLKSSGMKKLRLVLLKQSISTFGQVEGFANALNRSREVLAVSVRHWSPWNGCVYLNIAYLLRVSSVPHIPLFCSVLLWETILCFILCFSDCQYNCLLTHLSFVYFLEIPCYFL